MKLVSPHSEPLRPATREEEIELFGEPLGIGLEAPVAGEPHKNEVRPVYEKTSFIGQNRGKGIRGAIRVIREELDRIEDFISNPLHDDEIDPH